MLKDGNKDITFSRFSSIIEISRNAAHLKECRAHDGEPQYSISSANAWSHLSRPVDKRPRPCAEHRTQSSTRHGEYSSRSRSSVDRTSRCRRILKRRTNQRVHVDYAYNHPRCARCLPHALGVFTSVPHYRWTSIHRIKLQISAECDG